MDAKLIETLFEILMNIAVLTGLMQSPPKDLMSVCTPEQVLEVWGQDASPAALQAFLEGRKLAPEALKFDAAALEKRLREGNPKERRQARAELIEAGESGRALLTRLAGDADPELAEPARKQLAQFNANEAKRKAEKAPDLRPWAVRRLGQVRFQAARPVLEKLAKSDDLPLARECAAALRALDVKPDPAVKLDLPRLARALPPEISFGMAVDLHRGASEKSLEERLAVIPKDKAPGLGELSPFLARQISRAVDQVGNVEIHAAALSMTVDEVKNQSGGRLLVQGWFDLTRCRALIPQEAARCQVGGREFVQPDGKSALHLSESLLLAVTVEDAAEAAAAMKDVAGRYDQDSAKAPEILAHGIALIDSGKARICLAGRFNPAQRDKVLKGLAEMRAAAGQIQAQGFEVLGMIDFFESVVTAKCCELSFNDSLMLAGVLHCQDAAAAGQAEASLLSADRGIRKSLATGGLMVPELQRVLSRIDLSQEMFSGKADKSEMLFTCSDTLPRLIFGGIATATAQAARANAEFAAEAEVIPEPLPPPAPEPSFDP